MHEGKVLGLGRGEGVVRRDQARGAEVLFYVVDGISRVLPDGALTHVPR